MNCKHTTGELKNFREPDVGDVASGGEVGLLADCPDCEETILLRLDVIEKMGWP